MFPLNENRNEGTFACSPGTKTGTRAHSPKPPFYETALLSPNDSRARDIFGTLQPSPEKLLGPSLIDFRGNSGIRDPNTCTAKRKINEQVVLEGPLLFRSSTP